MTYTLRYSKKADKQLSKLDAQTSKIIVAWLTKNIKGCEDPRAIGGSLKAGLKDRWRYKVGSYRVLVKIDDEELVVLAVQIGHRKEVYKRS